MKSAFNFCSFDPQRGGRASSARGRDVDYSVSATLSKTPKAGGDSLASAMTLRRAASNLFPVAP